jgi:hypothetical protein
MKTILLGGALGLVALAGCATITDRTGITKAQQLCVAEKVADAVQAGSPSVNDIDPIATACGIDLTAWAQSLIGTALVAAAKVE